MGRSVLFWLVGREGLDQEVIVVDSLSLLLPWCSEVYIHLYRMADLYTVVWSIRTYVYSISVIVLLMEADVAIPFVVGGQRRL